MNRKLVALLCVALMLAISVPTLAAASPSPAAGTVAGSANTASPSPAANAPGLLGSANTASSEHTGTALAGYPLADYITARSSKSSVYVGQTFYISGYFKNYNGQLLVGKHDIWLQYWSAGRWLNLGKKVVAGTGYYSFAPYIKSQTYADQTWYWRVWHQPCTYERTATSHVVAVTVHKIPTYLSFSLPSASYAGSSVKFAGTLQGGGYYISGATVYIQEWINGRWVTIAHFTNPTDYYGRYQGYLRLTNHQVYYFRTVFGGSGKYRSCTSAYHSIRVY